ncbi:MAG TPA: hypothetical protein VMR86_22550 [Myxococcota bacterium]|nr:hypothetical protein [Myxococcota bacterium]
MKTLPLLSLSGALLALPLAATASSNPARLLDSAHAKQVIQIEDVTTRDGQTSGTIVNSGKEPIRDVELLVQHQYRWPNEFKPGKRNPGVAHEITIGGTIPPGGREPFTVASAPPATPQKGGSFTTDVKVLAFEQVEPVTAARHPTPGM